ncbi:MAG: hypothetical protein ACP5US_12820, partial [Candidatus Kryptoniota bacterium]
QAVDSFYTNIFHPSLVWDTKNQGLPPKLLLGDYKAVLWVADDKPVSGPHAIAKMADSLEDYLNVGGNLVVSGWQVLSSFNWGGPLPMTFKVGSFVRDYLHVNTFDESPTYPPDFKGASGVNGFPSVSVDAQKLSSFPYYGKGSQITVITQRGPFAQPILSYRGTIEDYAGRICGLKYVGTAYRVVVVGFPLYFLQSQDAQVLAVKLMEVIGG